MLKTEKNHVNYIYYRIKEIMKMKAQIRKGADILPKKLMKSIHLPENGECEIIAEKEEIKIINKNVLPIPYDVIEDIKNSKVTCSIDKMVKDESVEDR